MSLFGKLVKTAVNTAVLPLAVAADVVTLGDVVGDEKGTFTTRQLDTIKREADDDD